ncbi:hypothetical protein Afil01_10780 [Actinorhabdospora filicis]|uniref:DUF1996 domain-containing protein n=1 Tax=Actinorhabdospora filicis TaxID=1785913 RepID=A0A9W6SKH4_9ACTN|nr:hypothetical protein Afil01_10780 [Actinorhabdospora filicis]
MRAVSVVSLLFTLAACGAGGTDMSDVDPMPVPVALPGASTGTYSFDCGTGGDHRNGDNMITSPGQPGAAHHLHEYVGNTSTGAGSTEASLLAASTTCGDGDKSAYYWPVLRTGDPHDGEVVTPSRVELQWRGNAAAPVIAPPMFTRMLAGNAKAVSSGGAFARPSWTCEGFADRVTNRYPACPEGAAVMRVHDFPSCWDGRRADSPDHRAHLTYPAANGVCQKGTFAVPQLRLVVSYDLGDGPFTVDTFPEEANSAAADHADAVLVVPAELMAEIVRTLNAGERR